MDEAVAALLRGDVVVLPTETVYGLAATFDNVDKIFELKGRDSAKVLQVLVPDATWLERLGDPSAGANAVASAFWPGPLTLVVKARPETPAAVTKDGAVGIRVPGNDETRAILARVGAVAASSANRSGEQTPHTIAEIEALFGKGVAVYVNGGEIRGTGSTVIDMTADEPRLIREGPILFEDVKAVL